MRFRHVLVATLSITTGTALATTVAVQRLDSDLNKRVQPFQPHTVQYLQKLPLKTITACWAWLGSRNLPTPLREPTYRCYCNIFGCNAEEASEPLSNYHNLHQFFARSLRPGARVFQEHAVLNAPSDGTVVNCGRVVDDQIEQVKGMPWKLTHLIPCGNGSPYQNYGDDTKSLFFLITYLAPGDYHNFHSPCDWHIQQCRHHTGSLLPVAPVTIDYTYLVSATE
ncbi:phosphatidylserine decarboxylase isoform 1 [Galdieria sulphuraria]|uniref:Phosphatidylserine decarboxylase isoform 1 n=1 Tax=Galdieria sulphuraria TaxID=130081 RepID=M2Y7K5_GALSU|nr:phosphatidylserine decarboxylase isoform 1 [Galdieria sulphuraria]EME32043.1 phosphatidylserine decarboxylase isoform 1 [Galdieria sulphuraria]|eukprot:XP_005708563.1 phosphatidylserine decarboxylase isoform 1 [Galdieria sulphuraria]